jgi:hypothetical protein
MIGNQVQKLYVILDPAFGERLRLINSEPVWIVKSPINEPIIRSIWAMHSEPDHTKGITGFNYNEKATPEDSFLAELDMIDLHHGPYSANPPYTVLEVIGACLNESIKSALSELDFASFEEKDRGFTASRSLTDARKLREQR